MLQEEREEGNPDPLGWGEGDGRSQTLRLQVTITHNNEKPDVHVTQQQGCIEPVLHFSEVQLVEEATVIALPFRNSYLRKNFCSLWSSYCEYLGKKNDPGELAYLEKSLERFTDQVEEMKEELLGTR